MSSPDPQAALAATAEGARLADESAGWRRWGPYLGDRQWGTVREDYGPTGEAWRAFPHDQARARAYRWGEDGLGGFCDDRSNLCLSLALWNGHDPILKERLFGLGNAEGNHGEDVKELYHHLDGLPSHAYMRMVYKYPQARFPYASLVEESARRGLCDPEFDLLDAGAFDGDRWFDVEIEYAKAAPDDIVLRVTATNHGPAPATLWLAPQLVVRNRWSWEEGTPARPVLAAEGGQVVHCDGLPDGLPPMRLHCEGEPQLLFCDNDTDPRIFGQPAESGRYYKNGLHAWLIDGDAAAVNPAGTGTKAAALYRWQLGAGASGSIRMRLAPADGAPSIDALDALVDRRRAEADAWYAVLQRGIPGEDARRVHRQASAGLLWSKQCYEYDVKRWLAGDPTQPPVLASRAEGRNAAWRHLVAADVFSVPDSWEYPWPATWDLAFQALAFVPLDPAFAKHQLLLLTEPNYQHPDGQLPAYEFDFGSPNPPLHAWATLRVYELDRDRSGTGDRAFLAQMLPALLLNFNWWVGHHDARSCQLFQGGRLGLDNVSFFDRSTAVPEGARLDQADGTGWAVIFALALLRIAVELAPERPDAGNLFERYLQHVLLIAHTMRQPVGPGSCGLWDEEDGWCYDVLRRPDEHGTPLRVRSIVGLIPLCAVEVLDDAGWAEVPVLADRFERLRARRPDLAALATRQHGRLRLGLLDDAQVDRVLVRLFDEAEFLSPHGIRSLSKRHEQAPARFIDRGRLYELRYASGETRTDDTGSNSNWRGPVWLPMNLLIVEALRKYQRARGDGFRIEFPTGSGRRVTLGEAADRLVERLESLFLRGPDGRRPCFGERGKLQDDPRCVDHLLFHEFFDGDTGRGCGAAHQTGWTALIALLLQTPRTT